MSLGVSVVLSLDVGVVLNLDVGVVLSLGVGVAIERSPGLDSIERADNDGVKRGTGVEGIRSRWVRLVSRLLELRNASRNSPTFEDSGAGDGIGGMENGRMN